MPAPTRWTTAHTLDEAARRIADLALAACDGDGTRFADHFRPDRIHYPTRPNTEGLVRKALTPWTPDWPGYGKSEGFPDGITLADLFARAWDMVDGDPGDDQAALDLLIATHERIVETGGSAEAAAKVIAAREPDSLWWHGVTAALPEEPQTPGSEKYRFAIEHGNPTESIANPFRGWSK